MRPAAWLLALVGLAAQAGPAPKPLVLGFDSASFPTMYADERRQAAGVYPAIVRRAFDKMGEPVHLVAEPFKRVLADLRGGKMGVGSLVQTAERGALADFSAPYMVEQVAVYYRRGGEPYLGLDSLRGRNVGVIRGWSYERRFDAARAAGQFNVEEVGSDVQNFLKLNAGRIDYALATTLAGEALSAEPRFAGIVASPQLLVSVPIRIAFNKAAGRKALLRRFDDTIQAMRASGEIEQIVAQELARVK